MSSSATSERPSQPIWAGTVAGIAAKRRAHVRRQGSAR
jgi:hypothetical protein